MERSALVTGAGRGIGRATALALAASGYRVFAGMRTPSSAPDLSASNPNIEVVPLDVTVEASIASAIQTIRDRTGDAPDLVVNNAGTAMIASVEELRPEEFRLVMETNVIGIAMISRAVIGDMRNRGSGRIINVGSIGGRVTTPCVASYCASKAALAAFTTTLRWEVERFGVQVVLVEPGGVRTDLIGPARSLGRDVDAQRSVYRDAYRGLSELMQLSYDRVAIEPERVARVILRAATHRRPSPRYVVGLDARSLAVLSRLPLEYVQDQLMQRMLRLVMSKGRLARSSAL